MCSCLKKWAVRAGAGHYHYREAGSSNRWTVSRFGHVKPGDVLKAPKGWRCTPETVPDGCCIKTPEGVERVCRTCGWQKRLGNVCARAGCGLPETACIDDATHWCPKPAKTADKPRVIEKGDWVWGVASKLVRRVESVRSGDGNLQLDSQAGHPTQPGNVRPISVGDKARVVDKPKTSHVSTITGKEVVITKLGDSNYGNKPAFRVNCPDSGRWFIWPEDLRMAE